MKQEIKYRDLENPKSIPKALDDCRFYLGDLFEETVEIFKKSDSCDRGFLIEMISFRGIKGYPAEVFVDNFGNIADQEEIKYKLENK